MKSIHWGLSVEPCMTTIEHFAEESGGKRGGSSLGVLRFEAACSQESNTCAHERTSPFAWLRQKVIVG